MIIQSLLEIDRQMLLVINGFSRLPLITELSLIISGVGWYGVLWLVIGSGIAIWEGIRDRNMLRRLLLAALSSYLAVDVVVKPLIGRLRPDTVAGVLTAGTDPSGMSFPSGHSSMAFALAAVFAAKTPRWSAVFYFLAFLVVLSRIILGRHYPSDTVAGALLGYCIGLCVVRFTRQIEASRRPHPVR